MGRGGNGNAGSGRPANSKGGKSRQLEKEQSSISAAIEHVLKTELTNMKDEAVVDRDYYLKGISDDKRKAAIMSTTSVFNEVDKAISFVQSSVGDVKSLYDMDSGVKKIMGKAESTLRDKASVAKANADYAKNSKATQQAKQWQKIADYYNSLAYRLGNIGGDFYKKTAQLQISLEDNLKKQNKYSK